MNEEKGDKGSGKSSGDNGSEKGPSNADIEDVLVISDPGQSGSNGNINQDRGSSNGTQPKK
jgi:hypothetical protein